MVNVFSFILKEKPSSNCAVSKTLFITIKFMLCEIIKVDFIPFAYPSIKYQSFMLELYACKNFPGFYNFLFHQDINHFINVPMQRNNCVEMYNFHVHMMNVINSNLTTIS